MKVHLDVELCTGHGRCYALAPEVYDADDHGHCVVLDIETTAAGLEQARTGARNCPEGALRVED